MSDSVRPHSRQPVAVPGSPVPGTLQARTLEWVAISFSNEWKWKVKGKLLSCARLLSIPWTAAYQAPPFLGSSRQEYWSGLPFPSPKCMLSMSKKLVWKQVKSCSKELVIWMSISKYKNRWWHLRDPNKLSFRVNWGDYLSKGSSNWLAHWVI